MDKAPPGQGCSPSSSRAPPPPPRRRRRNRWPCRTTPATSFRCCAATAFSPFARCRGRGRGRQAGKRVVARWRRGEEGGVFEEEAMKRLYAGGGSRYGARWRQLPYNVSSGVVRNKDGRDAPQAARSGAAANKSRNHAVPPDSASVCMQTVRCRPPRATSKLSTVSWYGLPVPCSRKWVPSTIHKKTHYSLPA